MSTHWNIQIGIQEVEEPEPIKDNGGYVKSIGGKPIMTERRVSEALKLAVTADSEEEAYAKAHRMLNANAPASLSPWEESFGETEHLHRASCDDSGGNLVCGYPRGRTIADNGFPPGVRGPVNQ